MIFIILSLFIGMILGVVTFIAGLYVGYILNAKESVSVKQTIAEVKDKIRVNRKSEILKAQTPEQKKIEDDMANRKALSRITGDNPNAIDPQPEVNTTDVMNEF